MKGSLILLSVLALGVVVGMLHIIPRSIDLIDLSFYALLALLFSIGFNLGQDEDFFRSVKKIKKRLYLLPFMTILGTLFGCFVLYWFWSGLPLTEILALGSGMGYYSLSSILITKYIGVRLGIVALLVNIIRESLTLLLAPLIVKYFGGLSLISIAGVTSMDVCLPVITRYAGKDLATVSVAHGVLCDSSVPFLVAFFCMM